MSISIEKQEANLLKDHNKIESFSSGDDQNEKNDCNDQDMNDHINPIADEDEPKQDTDSTESP